MVYTAMRGRPRRLLTRYRTRTKRQRRRSVKASPHLCHGDRRPLRTVDVLRVSQSSSGVNRDDDAKDSVIWRHSAPFSERTVKDDKVSTRLCIGGGTKATHNVSVDWRQF